MSDRAPKKIWVEKRGTRVGWTSEPIISKSTDIPYIREDLVLELVEALKNCLEFNGYYFDTEHALAALAKLEESHE